jgi:hypothetical protein
VKRPATFWTASGRLAEDPLMITAGRLSFSPFLRFDESGLQPWSNGAPTCKIKRIGETTNLGGMSRIDRAVPGNKYVCAIAKSRRHDWPPQRGCREEGSRWTAAHRDAVAVRGERGIRSRSASFAGVCHLYRGQALSKAAQYRSGAQLNADQRRHAIRVPAQKPAELGLARATGTVLVGACAKP